MMLRKKSNRPSASVNFLFSLCHALKSLEGTYLEEKEDEMGLKGGGEVCVCR